mgnify:CR=1 FL=1
MAQTLGGYITSVRRLLHDANGNFYSDSQLTDYINQARERVVRDTGCLRTIQVTQVPLTPVAGGKAPYFWSAGGTASTGDYVVYNIFIYYVVAGGTFSTVAPPYPSGNYNYPPTTPFTNGTVTLQYAGPSEVLNWSCLPQGVQTLDIVNINLYWGNTRVPQRYMPWTQFNSELRFWQNYIGRPIAYSNYGQAQTFISPVPDQVYQVEIDTIVLPTPLVAQTDVDSINDPYYTPVQFYAAYLAKYYEQSFGEAEIYKQEYIKHTQAVLVSVFTRRIPDPYSTPY